MESNKAILAAIDFGPETEIVLSYAVWLSRALGDGTPSISMLNVMDYSLTPPAYLLPYLEKEEEAGGHELKKWIDRILQCGVPATGKIAVGRLVETFDKAMKDFQAAALVVGYKSHIIRASSSERLIKSLEVPVLVVKGRKAGSAVLGSVPVKNILCAIDFSGHSRAALEFALKLSGENQSSLAVAHILSTIELEKSFGRPGSLSLEDKQKYMDHAIREAEKSMASYACIPDNVERIVRAGVTYKVISDIASERDADLIVVGAQGASSTRGVLLGSIAEAVVKSAPCPVMIVRR